MTAAEPVQPAKPLGDARHAPPWEPSATSPEESGRDPQARSTDDPDRQFVLAAVGGDKRAFEELVKRHQDSTFTRIYLMVRDRGLAEDLTQEAFLKVYRSLDGFRGESLFSTWLGRVAVNVAMHHFERERAQKRAGRVVSLNASNPDGSHAGAGEIADRRHDPEAWAIRNERQRAILDAIMKLEDDYRLALALRELYGFSYQEIGDELELPIGTVKSKIFRARQLLQEMLKDAL